MSAVATRPYVMAGAALAAAGLVSVTPIAPRPSALAVLSIETRLVDAGDSILNIPFNLFQDFVNIPANEVGALNLLADSLFHTGTWVASSATNLWGEDPGDPGRFMALVDMLVPFSAISGLGQPEIDPVADAAGTAGLGQQLALFLDAEIPVSASSSATWTDPLGPVAPITGLTAIDRPIWFLSELTGLQKFPLFDNWFRVPISDLTSGNFNFGNVVDPSAGVGPNGSVLDSFGLPGTHVGTLPDGTTANLMPWSGIDFKLDPLAPFQNFYNSLLAPPDLNGFDIPTFEEVGRTLQSLAAGAVVDFYPYVPGNVISCPGACNLPEALSQEGIVRAIGDLWPGNTTIDQWLQLTDLGQANGPTQAGIDFANLFFTGPQQWFDFGNPLPDSPLNPIPVPVGPALQSLIDFMQSSGIQDFVHSLANSSGFTPIDYSDPNFLVDSLPPADGGLSQLLSDLGLAANSASALTDLTSAGLPGLDLGDPSALLQGLDLTPLLQGLDLTPLLQGLDLTPLLQGLDLGELINFGNLGTDLGAQLPGDLAPMLLNLF